MLSGNVAGLYLCHWHGALIRVSGPGQEKIAHLDAKDWSLTFQELVKSKDVSEFVNELFEDLDSDNICFGPRLFHLSTDSGSFFENCSSLKDGSC